MRTKLHRDERGAALLEAAVTIPLILLISVAIFEFGRAYQTWQVLTNAAREGARVAILPETTDTQVKSAVTTYMTIGRLSNVSDNYVTVQRQEPLGSTTGSRVTISYPFQFIVLNPIVRLVSPSSSVGAPLTMSAVAIMRNE